ncbi:peptidoglycan DD-metalloendopeptidase family protein [Isoalcanivorax indicus]|uniref:peptidoglycan DD-metalloendopeptidase family protein n=1 Tax=Isoalcanivorax indicus TaxID=2202653 RepID=UPI001B872BBD|nr:peptidoglycan DD-metalloendopeptidase family protein [Isoalcanivorax indicus]
MRRLAGLALLVLCSAGCAANQAPVVEYDASGARSGTGTLSSRPSQVTQGSHTVVRGDTLFSIAWRYGWDYRELAAANNISAPFTIRPGQEIRLDRRAPATAGRPASPPASTAQRPPQPQTPAPTPQQPPRQTPASPPQASSPPAASTPSTPPRVAGTGDVQWRWPASGDLLSRFSAQQAGQTGIRIAGRDGDPVVAAAAGVVVYRGNGLTGYGNLLIVKHNDRWLSAYAHNDSMLVREGDSVDAGQRIATMGATGTFRTQLHFEIRRDGQPVDPLTLLPRRS